MGVTVAHMEFALVYVPVAVDTIPLGHLIESQFLQASEGWHMFQNVATISSNNLLHVDLSGF
jgi:hypothetical protein